MNRALPEMLNCMNAPGTFLAGNCTDMTVLERQRARMKWHLHEHNDPIQLHQQQQGYNFSGNELSGVFSVPIPAGQAQGFMGLVCGDSAVKPDPCSENRWAELGYGSCGLVVNNNGAAGFEEMINGRNNNSNISRTFSCPPTVAAEKKSNDAVLSQKISLPTGKESFKKRKADKVQSNKAVAAEDDSTEKRMKGCAEEGDSKITEQTSTKNNTNNDRESSGDTSKDNSKASEVQKPDYIHVRARRGQATDSHSLAERVRREKISERMKYLQDLVPEKNPHPFSSASRGRWSAPPPLPSPPFPSSLLSPSSFLNHTSLILALFPIWWDEDHGHDFPYHHHLYPAGPAPCRPKIYGTYGFLHLHFDLASSLVCKCKF